MATSRSFPEFSRRMRIRARELEKGVTDAVRAAALAADAAIVVSTPVDTGQARANWTVSFGSPSDKIVNVDGEAGAAAGTLSIEEARQKIASWKIQDGSIFISNSLPYIGRLEDGSSRQAPMGMTKFGVAAAQSVLRAAKLLKDN